MEVKGSDTIGELVETAREQYNAKANLAHTEVKIAGKVLDRKQWPGTMIKNAFA